MEMMMFIKDYMKWKRTQAEMQNQLKSLVLVYS